MRSLSLLLAPLLLAALAPPAETAELARINRTIAKEPTYQAKSPQYCLLVFGPEAKTHVWLVVDGKVLYADLNGNGDLTEKGKQFKVAQQDNSAPQFTIREITEADGKTKHANLVLTMNEDRPIITVSIGGQHTQYAGYDLDKLQFGARPQDAPIVHFHGPLTMHLSRQKVFAAGKEAEDLYAELGTPGVGKGSFASISYQPVPAAVHPQADIEWPVKSEGGSPLKTTVSLAARC